MTMSGDVLLNILAILVWGGGFIAILVTSRAVGLWPLRVSVPQLFIIKGLLVSYTGYPLLLFQFYDYRVSAGITDTRLIVTAMLSAFFAIFIPVLVFGVFRLAARHLTKNKPSLPCTSRKASQFYWGGLFFVIVAVTFLYLQKVPNIALVEALTGGDVALARSKMTNDFSGKYHWYSLFFVDLAWLVTLVFYVVALSRKDLRYWLVFLLIFSFSTFSLTMTGQKAPFVWLIGTIIIAHYAFKQKVTISWKTVAFAVPVGLSFLVTFYILFMGVDDIDKALSSISSRALTGQLSGSYNYLWIFPDKVDYLMGRSLPNPHGIFPFEHFRLTVEVMEIVNPQGVAQGIVGSQPTMYWGEAYANFGWLGVLLVPIYVGIFLFLTSWLVSQIKTREIRVAALPWVAMQISTFASSGFSWSLLPVKLAIGMMIIFLHEFCFRKIKALPDFQLVPRYGSRPPRELRIDR